MTRSCQRVQTPCPGVSMTKQSFKDECDINNIMARYQKTGIIDHFNTHAAQYGETSAHTFSEAMFIVADAQSMFNELPSKARAHFHNNPAEFLEFTDGDPDLKTLIELGLTRPGTVLPDPLPNDPAPADAGEIEATDGD